jgi:hypothetical protein
MDDVLLHRVLYGISCRNYEAAAEAIPGAIGLSSSTVSRRFVEASAQKLKALQERDLSEEDVVAIFLDGKTFAEDTMVLALGITLPDAFAGRPVTIRITLEDELVVYDGDTVLVRHRLQPAAQGWVTVPDHHAALWHETLRVERRPLDVYEEVGRWS